MSSAGFHGALLGLVGATVAVGALWDVYRYRIPNAITFTAIALGLAYHAGIGPDARGLTFSLIGLLVLLSIGFFLFANGWLGAGDAKLLGAVGALLGAPMGLNAFLYASVIGGVWAIAWVRLATWGGLAIIGIADPRPRGVPYGVAIAAGTIAALAFPMVV